MSRSLALRVRSLAVAVLVVAPALPAQRPPSAPPGAVVQPAPAPPAIVRETVYVLPPGAQAAAQADSAQRAYYTVIANVNDQLANAQTGWSLLLGGLAVLFTAGAIVVGVAIWRAEAGSRAERAALTAQYRTRLQELDAGYTALIGAAQEQLATLRAAVASATTEREPDGTPNPELARIEAQVQTLTRQLGAMARTGRRPGRIASALRANPDLVAAFETALQDDSPSPADLERAHRAVGDAPKPSDRDPWISAS